MSALIILAHTWVLFKETVNKKRTIFYTIFVKKKKWNRWLALFADLLKKYIAATFFFTTTLTTLIALLILEHSVRRHWMYMNYVTKRKQIKKKCENFFFLYSAFSRYVAVSKMSFFFVYWTYMVCDLLLQF